MNKPEIPVDAWKIHPSTWVVILCLCAHLMNMIMVFQPVSFGVTAPAYQVQARLIAQTSSPVLQTTSPLEYVPQHWQEIGEQRFASTFPPGAALLQALGFMVGGALLINLFNLLITTFNAALVFLILRSWLGHWWGIFGMLSVISMPTANIWAYNGDSHPAVATMLLLGIYLLLQWHQTRQNGFAFWGGFAVGALPAFHYHEGICIIGVVALITITLLRNRGEWFACVLMLTGAFIPIQLLLFFHVLHYGAPLPWIEQLDLTVFHVYHIPVNFIHYLLVLSIHGIAVFMPLGIAGLVLMVWRPQTRPLGVFLSTMFAFTFALYCLYFFRDKSGRFLLPQMYLLALASTWFLAQIVSWKPKVMYTLLGIILTITLVINITNTRTRVRDSFIHTHAIKHIQWAVHDHIQLGSIVISSHPIQQSLCVIGQWKLLEPNILFVPPGLDLPVEVTEAEQRHNEQLLGPVAERKEAVRQYISHDPDVLSELLLRDLHQWAGENHQIFWVGNRDRLETLDRNTPLIDVTLVHVFDNEVLLSRERSMNHTSSLDPSTINDFKKPPPPRDGSEARPQRRTLPTRLPPPMLSINLEDYVIARIDFVR